jgi:ketol-acid reductoisomerase
MRKQARGTQVEEVGARLRTMMPWLHSDEKVVPDA